MLCKNEKKRSPWIRDFGLYLILSPSDYGRVTIRTCAASPSCHMSRLYQRYLHLIDRQEKRHEISLKRNVAGHKSVPLKHRRVIDNGIIYSDTTVHSRIGHADFNGPIIESHARFVALCSSLRQRHISNREI